MVDAHLDIPEFLTRRSRKQLKIKKEREKQKRHECLYEERLQKIHTSPSTLSNALYTSNVEAMQQHMTRMKANSRKRSEMEVKEQNRLIIQRLSSVKSYYSNKKLQAESDAQRKWLKFVSKDNTLGHLIHVRKDLSATNLPPLTGNEGINTRSQLSLTSVSLESASLRSCFQALSAVELASIASSQFQIISSAQEIPARTAAQTMSEPADSARSSVPDNAPRVTAREVIGGGEEKMQPLDIGDRFQLLASRTVPCSPEMRNCSLQLHKRIPFDDCVYVKAFMYSEPNILLAERRLAIADVYEWIDDSNDTQPGEETQYLRATLMNMFKHSDIERNGFLTYDDFVHLMQQIDLGMSVSELRFVLAEADENDNGMIDYHEFVPLAVDLIQGFQARNRARRAEERKALDVEDQVISALSLEELESTYKTALGKLRKIDSRNVGALKAPDMKFALRDPSVTLSVKEANMVCQLLPRDTFGRLVYVDELKRAINEARFVTVKNALLEARSSEVQRVLMEACQAEERKTLDENAHGRQTLTGWISIPAFMNLLVNSPRLSLTRFQAMVQLSNVESVAGTINYKQFAPICARSIEMMFEPTFLRQRAALIEQADLSPQELLNGVPPEVFKERVMAFFQKHDVDNSGMLDPHEFRACLASLHMNVSTTEVHALMAIADKDQNGQIDFDEFSELFMTSILQLEKEKRIQRLQQAAPESPEVTAEPDVSIAELETRVRELLTPADREGKGKLSVESLQALLAPMNVRLSPFQLTVLMSEVDADERGVVHWDEFAPVCAQLLQLFKAREESDPDDISEEQVTELTNVMHPEIERNAIQLMKHLEAALEAHNGGELRAWVKRIVCQRMPSLSRTERNLILARLGSCVSAESIEGVSMEHLMEYLTEAKHASLRLALMGRRQHCEICIKLITRFAERANVLPSSTLYNKATHLPIHEVYTILEHAHDLRLTTTQMLGLVSWASISCFDKTGAYIDYRCFARYASHIIPSFTEVTHLQRRAAVLAKSAFYAEDMLHAMSEQQVFNAFKGLLSRSDGTGTTAMIAEEQAFDALTQLPAQLTAVEKKSLLAAMHVQQGIADLQEWCQHLHTLLLHVICERKIQRRLAFSEETPSEDVQLVADKLVALLKVKRVGKRTSIFLLRELANTQHSFAFANAKRREVTRRARGLRDAEISSREHVEPCVLKKGRIVHVQVQHGTRKPRHPTKMAVLFDVRCVQDDGAHSVVLQLRATDALGCTELSHALHLKMPSIAQVDEDAAVQFATAAVDNVYITTVGEKLMLGMAGDMNV